MDIKAATTTITDLSSEKMDSARFGGSMNENACFPLLPIFHLLGTDVKETMFIAQMKGGVDIYTKTIMLFDHASASFEVGLGAKTEGSMVVSGTKGYAYVPAPWWKTDFFELRYEDQNQNKKFFYPFAGEGLRYEIKDFIGHVFDGDDRFYKLTREEVLKMSLVQQLWRSGTHVFEI